MSFKFKIDPKQTAEIQAKFRKDMNEILGAEACMRDIGEFMKERIKYQARTQAPLNQAGLFQGLETSTINRRKYLEKYNKTQSTYAPSRSNLTFTGALLDSLTYVVNGPGLIALLFSGQHPRYSGKNGPIGKEVSNADLAKWQADKGRPVFDKALKDNPTIKARIKTIALSYIRRGLKVRNKLR